MSSHRVLVTGAAGYIGSLLVAELATLRQAAPGDWGAIVAADMRDVPAERRQGGVTYARADVRDPQLVELMRQHAVTTVVHLASIVTPGPDSNRELEYAVDVLGTANVLEACRGAGVRRIVVTSSGAAYGYRADNPPWIDEDQALRASDDFAYARHKRLVEEMLARWRIEQPQLEQVVFRIGTILGQTVRNQITDLFEKPRLIAIRGSDSPFVFIWDRDVVGCLLRAITGPVTGTFNVAGDGALTIHDIAARLGKPVLSLPAWLLQGALAVLKPLGLTQYGPEQVDFLRYRPVLANRRLKEVFGYVPHKTSRETFELYLQARRR